MTGIELLRLRRSVRMSQRQVAEAIGVTAPAISAVERGLNRLSAEHARGVREAVEARRTVLAEFSAVLSQLGLKRKHDSQESVSSKMPKN